MGETAEQRQSQSKPKYRLGTSTSGVKTVTPVNAAARRDMRSGGVRSRTR